MEASTIQGALQLGGASSEIGGAAFARVVAQALTQLPESFSRRLALTRQTMRIESAIRLLAGSLILISLALAQFVGPRWLLLAAFVGLNLAQLALTGFCPAEVILKRLGVGGSCCGSRGET